MTKRVAGLAAVLLSIGCGQEDGTQEVSPDSLGTHQAAISYYRGGVTCRLSGSQEDIDTRPFPLQSLVFGYRYTMSNEPIPGFSSPAITWPEERTRFETLYRFEWLEEPAANATLPFGFAEKLKAEVPNLALLELPPSTNGSNPTKTLVFDRVQHLGAWQYSDFRDIAGDQIASFKLEERVAGKTPFILAEASKPGRLRLTLSKSETDALLERMGAPGPLPASLPELGTLEASCESKQLHVAPSVSNGLSFHLRLCCEAEDLVN